jgi:ATP-binding cassette subfamily B protein
VSGRAKPLQQSLPSLAHIVRRFWPHIREQRTLLAWSVIALLAEVTLKLLEPWPLKFVLDRVIVLTPTQGRSGIPVIDTLDSMTLLTLSALAVVIVTGLRGLAEYYNAVWMALVGDSVVTRIRGEVYAHVQRLSLSFHDRARGGDLLMRVTADAAVLREVTITALVPLLTSLISLVGMIGFMFWVNWQLTALALLPVPLAAVRMSRLGRRMRETSRKMRRVEGAMAATAAESIGAMRAVHALSLGGRFEAAFATHNEKSLKDAAKATRAGARLERSINIFTAISTAIVLWQGGRLVLQGVLTPGDLIVYLTYLKNTFRPGRDFAKHTTRLGRASASGERVIDLLDRAPDVRDLPGAAPAPAFAGTVRFDKVTFHYEPDRVVLQDIDFTVRARQRVALMGPSGSGKSTLISLILRLYDPTAGRVLIDGRDIREYTLDSLRAQVSIVLQDPWLFGVSVRDNIAYGLHDASFAEIEAAARLSNADEFIRAMPQQYETVLGERGVTLSNGQRQRIALARAAIRPAPILILDEPTTGLDKENERAVLRALDRVAAGRTVFLITHDPLLAERADLILYLEGGRVVECGTPAELLRGGTFAGIHRFAGGNRAGGGNQEISHAVSR